MKNDKEKELNIYPEFPGGSNVKVIDYQALSVQVTTHKEAIGPEGNTQQHYEVGLPKLKTKIKTESDPTLKYHYNSQDMKRT